MPEPTPIKRIVIKKKTIITRPKAPGSAPVAASPEAAADAAETPSESVADSSASGAASTAQATSPAPSAEQPVSPPADAAPASEPEAKTELQPKPEEASKAAEPAKPLEVPAPKASEPPLARTDRISKPLRPETILQELPVEKDKPGPRIEGLDKSPKAEPVKFYCVRCGQKLAVPAAGVGKKILCPNCRNAIVVPPPLD